ncbi:MAG TPA: AMP-binding protein [Acidimicrobiia bacterium]|nr:AMP-binding protein [Acidimicrobiia bacterium]
MAGNWNFATCWEAIADGRPDGAALRHGARTVSWAEFDDRSARLAAGLAELGVGADSKVASYLYNGPAYVEATFATWKLRAVPVNVNYRYLEEELAYLLENSDAEVLFFHGSLSEPVSRVRDRTPKLRAVVQVDDGAPLLDGAIAYEELIATREPAPRIDRSGDDQYILYTGGTTGMPKGVMWRNDDLFQSLVPSVLSLIGEQTPDSPAGFGPLAARNGSQGRAPVHLPASPLMHGTGFFTSLQSLTMGGTIVTLTQRNFDAHELWRAVQAERVTQMAIVGDAFGRPMVAALEEAEARGEPYDLSSLVVLISSGVMWTAEVKEALMARGGFVCLDSLGSSEGVGFANQISVPGSPATTAKFQIGEHTRVLTEEGREVAAGSDEIGLLALGGPIPLGYHKDQAKSEATFRTFGGARYSIPGDWAKVAADGTIELLGRGSVCINTGGEKVFPEEVEEAMKLHPSVIDAIVVGVPDDRFGEMIAAVVSVDGSTTEAEIADEVRGRLAGFKRPRHVVIVDDVPRGPNGKADYAWAKQVAVERAAVES